MTTPIRTTVTTTTVTVTAGTADAEISSPTNYKHLYHMISSRVLDALNKLFWAHWSYVRRRCVDPVGWDSWPLKICRRVRVRFDSLKMSHSFIQNCYWISFTSSRMKDVCQKWKVNFFFEATENSLMTWPDWFWPHILRQIYTIAYKQYRLLLWERSYVISSVVVKTFLGLETKTRSSGLETKTETWAKPLCKTSH